MDFENSQKRNYKFMAKRNNRVVKEEAYVKSTEYIFFLRKNTF